MYGIPAERGGFSRRSRPQPRRLQVTQEIIDGEPGAVIMGVREIGDDPLIELPGAEDDLISGDRDQQVG